MNIDEFNNWFGKFYDDIVFTMAASGSAQLHSDVFELPDHQDGLDISKVRDIWPVAPITVVDGVVEVDVNFEDADTAVVYPAKMTYPDNFLDLIAELSEDFRDGYGDEGERTAAT